MIKMVITFNYKDGTKTITLDDVKRAAEKRNTGSGYLFISQGMIVDTFQMARSYAQSRNHENREKRKS